MHHWKSLMRQGRRNPAPQLTRQPSAELRVVLGLGLRDASRHRRKRDSSARSAISLSSFLPSHIALITGLSNVQPLVQNDATSSTRFLGEITSKQQLRPALLSVIPPRNFMMAFSLSDLLNPAPASGTATPNPEADDTAQ